MKKNLWTKIGVAALALVLVVVSLVGIRAMSNTGSGSGSSGSSSASRPATLTTKSGTTVYQNGTALDRLDLDELTAESNGTTVYVDGEAVPEFDVDEYSEQIENALDTLEAALEGKADVADVDAAIATINEALGEKATLQYVNSAIDEAKGTKLVVYDDDDELLGEIGIDDLREAIYGGWYDDHIYSGRRNKYWIGCI